MSYDIDMYDLVYESEFKINEFVTFRNPSVHEVAKNKDFGKYTGILVTSTRELFSQFPEVDTLEKEYPTIIKLLNGKEVDGESFLGAYFADGKKTGSQILFESLSYWTAINIDNFKKLSNGKIVCTNPEWIIDDEEFENIVELVRLMISYEPNSDYIAPTNMTPTRHKTWLTMFKGRMKKSRRKKPGSIADKIMILSISNGGYIPVEEIRKMSFFHFSKLSILLSEKEGYELKWLLNASPNFETDTKVKHWKDTTI